jgi:hypothetical protein
VNEWARHSSDGASTDGSPDCDKEVAAFVVAASVLDEGANKQVIDLVEKSISAWCAHVWTAGHQQGKFLRCIDLLTRNQVLVMCDFKEKPKLTVRLNEEQSQHWDNKLQSLLGFIIVSMGLDGVLHREYIDVCSEVAVQDSDWVLSAMTGHILPILKRKHAHANELFGWSDNGSHFANNMVLAGWGLIGADLGVDVVWNFTEPGEGKSDCDRHFAQIRPVVTDFVVANQVLHGPEDMALACSNIKNTTGVVLKKASHKIKRYMVVVGLKKYMSFRMPNNGKKYGDAEYLCDRELSGSGDWCMLDQGRMANRQIKE